MGRRRKKSDTENGLGCVISCLVMIPTALTFISTKLIKSDDPFNQLMGWLIILLMVVLVIVFIASF